jgi:uncharacterized protein YuzB (UPF0349 family)
MNNFLSFSVFIESVKDGGWQGYAANEKVKLTEFTAATLKQLEDKIRLDILKYHCAKDMGASFIYDRANGTIIYYNMPCETLAVFLNKANINYELPNAQIAYGVFDSKQAQYRIDVKHYGHFAFCKVLGIFTEPNLLPVIN